MAFEAMARQNRAHFLEEIDLGPRGANEKDRHQTHAAAKGSKSAGFHLNRVEL
jgi:hypothetical protein